MRKVTCILCNIEVLLDENTLLAKQLKNNPIKTLCAMNVKVESIHLSN